jgi:carboxypeptidase Taq
MRTPAFTELKLRLEKIHDLERAKAVLEWDERTMMPPGGAAARVEQVASLDRVQHERISSPEIADLLEAVRPYEDSLEPESDDATLIRQARREHEKAARVPAGLRGRLSRAASLSENAWREARTRSDFSILLPHLEDVVALRRTYIDCFDADDPYDVLLDDFEPGMSTAEMARVLNDFKAELIPLVAQASERVDNVDDSFLHGDFPLERQRALVHSVVSKLPLPPGGWRLDETAHPFAAAIATTDLRITTRYDRDYFASSIFCALHELGHALYDSGVEPALERSPLSAPNSLGLHESQSQLWESAVGRSLSFWRHFYPEAQAAFPNQLGDIDVERFHRAVNKVQPSFIRVDADELTYDLHVILRFELEQDIFHNRLELRDLPEAWNAKMREYLGLEVPDDAHGVLQDVHWAAGEFGYFPTYSLGNVIRGQLWEAATEALPDLDEQFAAGDFGPLREWLRENLHRHGRKLTAQTAIERITGGPIDVGPYISYLRAKFGEIYALA